MSLLIRKENFFLKGAFVEAKHKANHNTKTDTDYGFYTNVATYDDPQNATIVQEYINTIELGQGKYHDWIIGGGAPETHEITLTASIYASEVIDSVDQWHTQKVKLIQHLVYQCKHQKLVGCKTQV